jgi:hypothetical protein
MLKRNKTYRGEKLGLSRRKLATKISFVINIQNNKRGGK